MLSSPCYSFGVEKGVDYLYCRASFCFFLIYLFLFVYVWLHWVFVAVHGLSLLAASGGYSSLR